MLINGTLSANFKVVTANIPMSDELIITKLLNDTENSLRQLALWSEAEPDEQALSSSQPFALDSLSPEEWLQWIFIPKMRDMLAKEQMPKGFSISPYFEEVWKSQPQNAELLALLHAIDEECR